MAGECSPAILEQCTAVCRDVLQKQLWVGLDEWQLYRILCRLSAVRLKPEIWTKLYSDDRY